MILISSGEPAGIGPDIILKAFGEISPDSSFENTSPDSPLFKGGLGGISWQEIIILGDIELFKERAKLLRLPDISFQLIPDLSSCSFSNNKNSTLKIHHVPLNAPCQPGILDTQNAEYVLKLLKTGAEACVKGIADALVTAPVHKGIIADAGFAFSGHTEYFAELTQTEEVVMMLATDKLRIALVTTHLPLRDVADAITPEKLTRVIQIIHQDLKKYFGLSHPKIYVAGLNPHAGENGHLGDEEIKVIKPTLEKIKKQQNIHLEGPFPADSLFTQTYLDKADVFLAMYHDQGLSVIKYAAFDEAVNITLGLPFIRTSVDHGTALDLAGTGRASEKSLLAAIKTAQEMVRNHVV